MKKRNDTVNSLRAIINAKEEAMKLQIAETDRLRLQNNRMRVAIQNLLKQIRMLKYGETPTETDHISAIREAIVNEKYIVDERPRGIIIVGNPDSDSMESIVGAMKNMDKILIVDESDVEKLPNRSAFPIVPFAPPPLREIHFPAPETRRERRYREREVKKKLSKK